MGSVGGRGWLAITSSQGSGKGCPLERTSGKDSNNLGDEVKLCGASFRKQEQRRLYSWNKIEKNSKKGGESPQLRPYRPLKESDFT